METLAEKRRRIGKLGGRPKGKKNAKTLEREKVAEAVNQQIFSMARTLIIAQKGSAVGSQYLYKIKTYKGQRSEPILVTSQDEIENYLRGDYDVDGDKHSDTEYYFLTTKDPETKASDSLLNRALGKAKEMIELSNPDGNLKTIIINKSKDK